MQQPKYQEGELNYCLNKIREYWYRVNEQFKYTKPDRGKVERLRWQLTLWEEEVKNKILNTYVG